MKIYILFFLLIFIVPSTIAQSNLEVEIVKKETVIIAGVDTTAKFDFLVSNKNNISDNFELYSLIGVDLTPRYLSNIASGGTKEFEVEVSLQEKTKEEIRGIFVFEYEIKGDKTGFYRDRLQIRILNLEDAFEIKIEDLSPNEKEANLIVKNLENYNFENLQFKAQSSFFEFSEKTSLKPFSEIRFTIPVDSDAIKELVAGEYELRTELEFKGVKGEIKEKLNYLEKSGLSASTVSEGFLIKKEKISKTNEGNTAIKAEIEDTTNIFTRLFKIYSPRPQNSERQGFFIKYKWEKELNPQESLIVNSTINYTFPFALLIIVILIIVLFQIYFSRPLYLEKRVSFVKTESGEFALKVKINAKARNHLDNVQIVDRLPRITKLYEKFGRKPDRIDEKTRRMFWNLGDLESGEERFISYIIYSKIKVIGKFELPAASGIYQKNSKISTVKSNKTYFFAESSKSQEDE